MGRLKRERIAKVIARSGLCSRRDAEVLIGEKRVSVNGTVIESAALDVSPSDKVLVDGKPLAVREPPRLWRYHKPKGRVTTHKDPEGRPTVFEALPEELPRLISVGRLDFNTEGLLLLTNDGDLARHLELPSTGWARRYRVRAFGQIEQSKLDELAGGLRTGGVNYGPIEATLEREQGDNVWITLSIREGKNREVRRIMEHLGLTVNRLIRISFGPFVLGELEPGQIEEVKTSILKDQLGPRLSRQLGVKRAPLREERRLPLTRSKPTYLRRKPSAPERPERPAEERPLKRRRVLQMDGSEAPRVELVPEKKRPSDRFKRAGEGSSESLVTSAAVESSPSTRIVNAGSVAAIRSREEKCAPAGIARTAERLERRAKGRELRWKCAGNVRRQDRDQRFRRRGTWAAAAKADFPRATRRAELVVKGPIEQRRTEKGRSSGGGPKFSGKAHRPAGGANARGLPLNADGEGAPVAKASLQAAPKEEGQGGGERPKFSGRRFDRPEGERSKAPASGVAKARLVAKGLHTSSAERKRVEAAARGRRFLQGASTGPKASIRSFPLRAVAKARLVAKGLHTEQRRTEEGRGGGDRPKFSAKALRPA